MKQYTLAIYVPDGTTNLYQHVTEFRIDADHIVFIENGKTHLTSLPFHAQLEE